MGIDGKSSEWSRWFASHSLIGSNLKMALDIWYSSASNALEAEEYQRRDSWSGSWLIHDCWLVSICVILLRNGYANKLQITVKTYLFQGEKVPQTPKGNMCQMHNNYCNCTVILTFILWLMIWKPKSMCAISHSCFFFYIKVKFYRSYFQLVWLFIS